MHPHPTINLTRVGSGNYGLYGSGPQLGNGQNYVVAHCDQPGVRNPAVVSDGQKLSCLLPEAWSGDLKDGWG